MQTGVGQKLAKCNACDFLEYAGQMKIGDVLRIGDGFERQILCVVELDVIKNFIDLLMHVILNVELLGIFEEVVGAYERGKDHVRVSCDGIAVSGGALVVIQDEGEDGGGQPLAERRAVLLIFKERDVAENEVFKLGVT